jgi:uncharacterized protein YceK
MNPPRISIFPIHIRLAFCASLLALCSGCGTFITHAFDEPHEAYNGVRFDAQCVSRGTAGFIIDMPFSAVADTLLLPVDLWPETQDPLKTGWTYYPLPDSRSARHEQNTNHLDQAIVDDYKNYIAKEHLFPESNVAGFYVDAKGRCAVKFEAYGDHETASHVLIYDNKNKRVKVVIFNRHRSVC